MVDYPIASDFLSKLLGGRSEDREFGRQRRNQQNEVKPTQDVCVARAERGTEACGKCSQREYLCVL